MMNTLQKIEYLKEMVFEQQNEHCFIERESFLNALPICEKHPNDYYAKILSDMLDYVSTPVDANDIFVGRVLENAPRKEWGACPNRTLFAKAHLTPDYKRLLTLGYRGILEQIKTNAERIGTAVQKARLCTEHFHRL